MTNLGLKNCLEEGCDKYARYGDDKTKRLYCSLHKKPNMIEQCHRNICLTENGDVNVSVARYRGFCFRCFVYLFPEEKNARNYRCLYGFTHTL